MANDPIYICCNKCGKDALLCNDTLSVMLFEIDPFIVVKFTCPSCKADYPLPVKLPFKE